MTIRVSPLPLRQIYTIDFIKVLTDSRCSWGVDADPGDGPSLDLEHLQFPLGDLDADAGGTGEVAEPVEDQTCHRGVAALGDINPEIRQVMDGERARDQHRPALFPYHRQNVWVGGRRILVNGQRTEHLRNAKYEAKRTSKLLSVAARALIDVDPIVAIVGAKRMTVSERPTDVAVLRDSELVRWLQRHPITLTSDQVQEIAALAAQPATWKRTPETEVVDHAEFDRLHGEIARAGRRRRGWAFIVAASMPVAFLFGWLTLLGALAR